MTPKKSLFKIHQGALKCIACRLHKSRRIAVPGEGPHNAKIMFVGEGPGRQEDAVGRPFVGPSGKFLDQLFERIHIDRKKVYITSVVKCRPSHNRAPKKDEYETCIPLWLDKQIEIIKPKLIVLLGGVAVKALLGSDKIDKVHGKLIQFNGRKYFPTYHPAAAMRFPALRRKVYKDFDLLKRLIKKLQ